MFGSEMISNKEPKICRKCGLICRNGYTERQGICYHINCFKCDVCHRDLIMNMKTVDKEIYCNKHYNAKYSKKEETEPQKKKKYNFHFELPKEIIFEIISFLGFWEQVPLSEISKDWNESLKDQKIVLEYGYNKEIYSEHCNFIEKRMNPLNVVKIQNVCLTVPVKEKIIFKNLKELSQKKYDGEMTHEIVQELSNFVELEKLSLFEFYENSQEALPDLIFEKCTKLKEIIFENDECDIDLSLRNSTFFTLAKFNEGNVRKLIFQGISYECDSSSFVEIVKKFQNLEDIELTYNYTVYDEIDSFDKIFYTKEFVHRLFNLPKISKITLTTNLCDNFDKYDLDSLNEFSSSTDNIHRNITIFSKIK
jgi:hypothetical protein